MYCSKNEVFEYTIFHWFQETVNGSRSFNEFRESFTAVVQRGLKIFNEWLLFRPHFF